MDQAQLINFLRRIYCWIPHSNPVRKEIKQVVEGLGGRVSELKEHLPSTEK